MESLNVILKYRRDSDCWICTDCETENPMSAGVCSVCSRAYDHSARILKRWTPGSDDPPSPPTKRSEDESISKTPTTKPGDIPLEPPKTESDVNVSHKGKVVAVFIAVILIVFIVIALTNDYKTAIDNNCISNDYSYAECVSPSSPTKFAVQTTAHMRTYSLYHIDTTRRI